MSITNEEDWLNSSDNLGLAVGVRLHWNEVRQQHWLLFPEGALLLNHTALAVLSLCNGDRSLDWIWYESEAFNRFRGTDWMEEPCRSCDRQEIDFGGCRCQALLLTGKATATDPVCHLSPKHHLILAKQEQVVTEKLPAFVYRSIGG